MSEHVYRVHCTWDPEASVWVAESEDVPGLATGAETLDALVEKLRHIVPELLEANEMLAKGETGDVAISIIAERLEHAPRAA